MKIQRWHQGTQAEQDRWHQQFRSIFFASSTRKNFLDDDEREEFWRTWTEFYFSKVPDLIFLARINDSVVGYLMGCADSTASLPELQSRVPSFALFADLFASFPAHLHINFSAEARGQGGGRQLVDAFIQELKDRGCPGVHVVTSPTAENVPFYRRLGFTVEVDRPWHLMPLLFMGRELC
jgi:ribosomal protein S18 acetylase RimI-like enzyme